MSTVDNKDPSETNLPDQGLVRAEGAPGRLQEPCSAAIKALTIGRIGTLR